VANLPALSQRRKVSALTPKAFAASPMARRRRLVCLGIA
jgi:hypothetical protein